MSRQTSTIVQDSSNRSGKYAIPRCVLSSQCGPTKLTSLSLEFLKQNMKLAKAAMPKATHGEVMRALSERWKATGGAKTPAEIVQAGEDPIAVQRAHAQYWQVMSLQMQGLSIA